MEEISDSKKFDIPKKMKTAPTMKQSKGEEIGRYFWEASTNIQEIEHRNKQEGVFGSMQSETSPQKLRLGENNCHLFLYG